MGELILVAPFVVPFVAFLVLGAVMLRRRARAIRRALDDGGQVE